LSDYSVEQQNELITINTLEDIRSRPAFREDIDPKQHKIAKLIGDYTFKDQVPCGLNDCHTPHNKGFLARTEDGLETIIGHVCGRKWGGESFVHHKRSFTQRKEYQQHSQLLNSIMSKRNEIEARIKEISERKFGAKWLIGSMKNFREICPDAVYGELSKRAIRGEPNVVEHRERSQEDINRLHAMYPNTSRESHRYEEVRIGIFDGLEIFKSSIHDLLILKVSNVLRELCQTDITSLKASERRKYVEWANQIENRFNEAEELLASGLRFFGESNIKLLHHLSKDKSNPMKKLKWNLEAGTGKN